MMQKRRVATRRQGKHVALVLVEGDTEVEFYNALVQQLCPGVSKKIRNLKGRYNINKKVADECVHYAQDHPDETFDVYICVDFERPSFPQPDLKMIRELIGGRANAREIHNVIVTIMIESLFFLDMDGLYDFLHVPASKRRPKKFANFRALTARDVSDLFRQNQRQYHKGSRCDGLVQRLSMQKMRRAEEIDNLIRLIAQNAGGFAMN